MARSVHFLMERRLGDRNLFLLLLVVFIARQHLQARTPRYRFTISVWLSSAGIVPKTLFTWCGHYSSFPHTIQRYETLTERGRANNSDELCRKTRIFRPENV